MCVMQCTAQILPSKRKCTIEAISTAALYLPERGMTRDAIHLLGQRPWHQLKRVSFSISNPLQQPVQKNGDSRSHSQNGDQRK
jgi:hypothetical protein